MSRHFRTAIVCTALAVLFISAAAGTRAVSREASFVLEKTIPLKGAPGTLDHLVIDAGRQRLLVANKANDTLDIVDLKGGTLLKQVAGQQGVQGVAYSADLDRVFVGLGSGGFCNVFDGNDYKLVKTVKFQDDADNVRYIPRTQTVYVVHAESALGVIDAKSYQVRADVKLPAAAEGMQAETHRPRLYLATPQPPQIIVLDTDKNEVVGRYPVRGGGKPYSLAMDEAGKRLFVGCRKPAAVIALDCDSGKEVASVPIPNGVDDLVFDGTRKRLYASCGEGFLAVLRQNGGGYELLEKIPTVKDAKTCCFAEAEGRLYLAVPRQPGKEGPEIHVYRARP